MALWKDQKDSGAAVGDAGPPSAPEPIVRAVERTAPASAPSPEPAPKRERAAPAGAKESLIAADVTIEGKIEGAGHVRIADASRATSTSRAMSRSSRSPCHGSGHAHTVL